MRKHNGIGLLLAVFVMMISGVVQAVNEVFNSGPSSSSAEVSSVALSPQSAVRLLDLSMKPNLPAEFSQSSPAPYPLGIQLLSELAVQNEIQQLVTNTDFLQAAEKCQSGQLNKMTVMTRGDVSLVLSNRNDLCFLARIYLSPEAEGNQMGSACLLTQTIYQELFSAEHVAGLKLNDQQKIISEEYKDFYAKLFQLCFNKGLLTAQQVKNLLSPQHYG